MVEFNRGRVWPSKRYEPVGQCIYCGALDKLTDEHIIPYSLGGDYILPKASCPACNDVTKKFENFCARTMLGPLRIRMGLKTRRKKQRPTTLDIVTRMSDGTIQAVPVDASRYPLACLGFRLVPPGYLVDRPLTDVFEGDMIVRYNHDELRPFLRSDGRGVRLGTFNARQFALMLAKIAHCHAVSTLGVGTFQAFLPDIILHRTDAAIPHYVGGDEERNPPPHPALHQLATRRVIKGGQEVVVVFIRLFALIGMPRYLVVAGMMKNGTHA